MSPVVLQETSVLLIKTWHLYYPQRNIATNGHHRRHLIRLHAASFEATKGFALLSAQMQQYSSRPVNTLMHNICACTKFIQIAYYSHFEVLLFWVSTRQCLCAQKAHYFPHSAHRCSTSITSILCLNAPF